MTKSYGSLQRLGKNFEDWMATVVSESVVVYLVFRSLALKTFVETCGYGLWCYTLVYGHIAPCTFMVCENEG